MSAAESSTFQTHYSIESGIASTSHMMMKKGLIIVGILWSLSTLSYAEQPLDILRNSIDESIDILKDSGYEDSSRKDIQRQKLWLILKQIFDFQEFTRLALGRNWNTFTPPQQREFTEHFSEFVNIYYLTRLQDRYNNEEVIFIKQNQISSTRAVVHVKVLWRNQEVPVDIRMLRRENTWRVYDIVALGISAVKFYRGQFRELLRNESPEQVIERLKAKIQKIEAKIQKY
jgi:phospholipid transport system substrate-binding protein